MDKYIKTIIAIAMVITMAIGLCSVAFASTVSPSLLPYMTDSSGLSAGGFVYWANGNFKGYAGSNSLTDCYAFLYIDDINKPRLCAVSESAFTLYTNAYNSQSTIYSNTAVLDNGYYIADTNISSTAGSAQIWTSTSKAEGIAACEALLNPIVSSSLDIVVPNGYALYVSIPAETVTIQLSATMPYNSELFGTPWPTIINYVNNVVSVPNVGDTVLVGSGWTGVEWEKSPTATTNIFGQTRYAVYSAYPSSGGWYVVYNPAVSWDSNLSEVSNPSILAHFNKAIEYRLYPTADGVISGVQSITLGNPWESSAEDNWQVTPPPGQDIIPPSGGNNSLPDDTGVEGILNRLVEMIRSIFEVAWRPIHEILQSVGGFFEKLADLWSWLPPEVSSLLISGLTIIIAVGVLKSFL